MNLTVTEHEGPHKVGIRIEVDNDTHIYCEAMGDGTWIVTEYRDEIYTRSVTKFVKKLAIGHAILWAIQSE